ncbi:hypothetical protein B4143_4130 [Bacillus subtilis]|nr:hypothetical protein ABU16_0096 [Bacillus subtilis]EME08953.1 hypothetical protein BS732_0182 [Bacillus subtilis MB73/2]KIN56426.1 hypothetical protein B4146_3540 [Bacillus subtilis]KIO58119.1 hypothetical protein B4143_4130 [Bacillus subtilis]KZD78284.1 hypothetical protein B4417_3073 [Bacillus subtilis]
MYKYTGNNDFHTVFPSFDMNEAWYYANNLATSKTTHTFIRGPVLIL